MEGTEGEIDRQAVYREWIERGLAVTGRSRTAFYKLAGVHASTASRNFDAANPTEIREDTIDRLAKHWRLAPPSIGPRSNGTTSGFSEPEVLLVAEPAAANGSKQLHADQSRWQVRTRALELLGYMPGDVVTIDRRVKPRTGDVVCVQVIDVQRGTAETLIRRYDAPYVMVATADPSIQSKPLQVDNERVDIVGVAIARNWTRG